MFVDEVLRGVGSEDSVVGKVFGGLVMVLSDEADLIIFIIDLDAVETVWNVTNGLLLSFSFAFMGLTRTMTLTA